MAGQVVERWRRASMVTAAGVMLLALVVLAGWIAGRQDLTRLFTPTNMKFNTAVGLTLLAAAALLQGAGGRSARFVRLPALAAALIGAITLLEYASGVPLGIDELIIADTDGTSTRDPGRMSPVAASLLLVLGSAYFVGPLTREILLVVAAALLYVALLGYLLGVAPFYGATTFTTGSSLHAIAAFLLLVVSAGLAHPDAGIKPLLRDPGPAGFLTRRLLPLAILVPPLTAWAALRGQEAGLYDDGFRAALVALVNAAAIATVAFVVIRAQARAQRERDAAIDALRRSHEELEERVHERTAELARVADDLRRSNRDLEEFAFLASHDLHAPLRQVSAFAKKIEEDQAAALDERNRQRLRFVVEGATKMGNLIDGLLALSRAGRREVKLADADPAALAKRALDVLAPDVEASGARVVIEPMPRVLADEELVAQVFQNLLANAIKYRDVRPLSVVVEGEEENGHARLRVRDNGRGVDPEYLDRIFGMFQREHVDVPGSGIGLALVKRVVERHGGRVGVTSRPGEGAEFWFTLPLAARRSAA